MTANILLVYFGCLQIVEAEPRIFGLSLDLKDYEI